MTGLLRFALPAGVVVGLLVAAWAWHSHSVAVSVAAAAAAAVAVVRHREKAAAAREVVTTAAAEWEAAVRAPPADPPSEPGGGASPEVLALEDAIRRARGIHDCGAVAGVRSTRTLRDLLSGGGRATLHPWGGRPLPP